jgi:redox-sensitive bicupin YhaK (pirin superfamily)
MITVRRSQERGHAQLGWLDSWHTFSFSNYYDPKHMGFHSLRVINDDIIAPGRGFGMHPHEDMEIITYLLDGELAHKDSLGTGAVLRPGDVQRMSAGTGMVHSEYNASTTAPARLLQIWIEPDRMGVTPRYEDRHFPSASRTDQSRLIASPDGRDGSLAIHQDALVSASVLSPGFTLTARITPGHGGYLQLARGQLHVPGATLSAGDAISCEELTELAVTAGAGGAEFLLFDVA